jgi:hypothetical protein
MAKEKELQLRDLGINISFIELEALQNAIRAFTNLKDIEDSFKFSFPDESGWRQIKPILQSFRTKYKRLSPFSRRRKFNLLPVDFVFTIIILTLVNTQLSNDTKLLKILVDLNAKMKSALETLKE